MITSAEEFNEAISLWIALTGLDPEAKTIRMDQWDLRSMNEELKESMEYDPSLATTYLLLDAFSTDYFKQAKVSVAEFDEDPDKVFDYMEKVRDFKKLIRSPTVCEVADDFLESIRKALVHYGVAPDRVEKAMEKPHVLAILRRDALRSVAKLRDDHFLRGETEEGSPIYNREVFGYWNVNSLVSHVCSMPSGIALNLIRDPDELHSYFAFSIRNGGNVIMLTDTQEYAHPLGRSMSRRPDRAFADRVSKNWFPYQLLQLKVNDRGDVYHDRYSKAVEQNIVPKQGDHFVLSKLADLEINQIIWLALVFDLIKEKFWNSEIPPKELSYTNEMIKLEDQTTLLASAAQANLPVVGYQPLSLPRLNKDDLRLKNLDEASLGESALNGEKQFGINQWMEERYGDLVPDEALNLVGPPSTKLHFLSLESGKETPRVGSSTQTPMVREGEVNCLDVPNDPFGDGVGRYLDTQKNPAYTLKSVDATLFGTRQQLDADRKFIGRFNFARAIQREADREFKADRLGVLNWFIAGVEKNIDLLLGYAHHEEVWHIRKNITRFAEQDSANGFERYIFSRLMPYHPTEQQRYEYPQTYALNVVKNFGGDFQATRGGFRPCYVTGAKPTYRLYIQPGCPNDLALLTGTPVVDMPEYLQNWNPGDEPYTGNNILSRIDPMEWRVTNPWNQISFCIEIPLSKNGLKKVLKAKEAAPTPETSHIRGGTITQQGGRRGHSHIYHDNWNTEKYLKGEL